MGIISSLTYNSGLARNNRETTSLCGSGQEVIPVENLKAGDGLKLEGKMWKVTEVAATGRKVSGLGLLRFGIANEKMYRVIAIDGSGNIEAFEMPKTYLVCKTTELAK